MSINIPVVSDTARRVARTVLQVIAGFGAFAAVYPLIVSAIGAPKGSNLAVWLAGSAAVVTGIAAVLARVMAIPAVNTWLGAVRLAGHSGAAAEAPVTELPENLSTTMVPVVKSSN